MDSISVISAEKKAKLYKIRPTFLEFSYRTLPAINYYPGDNNQKETSYEQNKIYNIKLNIPLIMSPKLSVFGQLRYKNEQLHLGEDIHENEKEIHFDNFGMSFLMKYKLNNNFYLAGHIGGFFKADNMTFENYSSILDYNSSLIFGKDIEYGTIGFGALLGNSLGRFRAYPLFLLDYQFSNKWKLEVKLPKEIQFRRILKEDNFYLLAGAEVNGAAYFISENIYNGLKNIEYRRAAIDLRIGLEKEIYDFLWIGADVGITQPLYSALVESGKPTRNRLFDFNHSFTPYGSISIYLVPPKSWMSKMK